MAKVILCTMANGATVYYDDEMSRTATHLAVSSQLVPVIKEYLKKQAFSEPKVFIDHDSGNIIGNSDLVETNDSDEIVYAKRLNRDNFTKFVKNRLAVPTSFFTLAMIQDAEGNYELVSTWIGRVCPNFPDEPNATPESGPFWANHALVFGNQAVQPETLTDVSPW